MMKSFYKDLLKNKLVGTLAKKYTYGRFDTFSLIIKPMQKSEEIEINNAGEIFRKKLLGSTIDLKPFQLLAGKIDGEIINCKLFYQREEDVFTITIFYIKNVTGEKLKHVLTL